MSQKKEDVLRELELLQERAKELRKLVPFKRKAQTLPKSMKDDEFTRLLRAIPKRKCYVSSKIAFLLAYECGLRVSEVCNLKKENIDVKGKRIYVMLGKFSKDRVVPLPKTWRSYMLDHIPIRKCIRSLERNFKTCAKLAGLKPAYVFHSLRHSFATNCLERGMPINQVSLLLGHSNISATNVYVRANPLDALKKYEEVF